MKKFLITLIVAVFLSVSFLGSASAVPTLPAPEWKLKFQNFEVFNPALVPNLQGDPSNPGVGDGIEDNWGIAQVTNILAGIGSGALPSWNAGDGGYEIYAVFGGLDVTKWELLGGTVGSFETGAAFASGITPFFDLYAWDTSAGDFKTWTQVYNQGPGGRLGSYGYDGISNGSAELLVAFDFASGISPTDAAVLTSGTTLLSTNPPTGVGSGYANVNYAFTGAWTNIIQPGFWSTPWGARDTKLVFNFDTDTVPAGWNLASDDPLEGGAIPEPGTFFLLGFGLLGIAGFGRRKKNSL